MRIYWLYDCALVFPPQRLFPPSAFFSLLRFFPLVNFWLDFTLSERPCRKALAEVLNNFLLNRVKAPRTLFLQYGLHVKHFEESANFSVPRTRALINGDPPTEPLNSLPLISRAEAFLSLPHHLGGLSAVSEECPGMYMRLMSYD